MYPPGDSLHQGTGSAEAVCASLYSKTALEYFCSLKSLLFCLYCISDPPPAPAPLCLSAYLVSCGYLEAFHRVLGNNKRRLDTDTAGDELSLCSGEDSWTGYSGKEGIKGWVTVAVALCSKKIPHKFHAIQFLLAVMLLTVR